MLTGSVAQIDQFISTNPEEAYSYAGEWEKFVEIHAKDFEELSIIDKEKSSTASEHWAEFTRNHPELGDLDYDLIIGKQFRDQGAEEAYEEYKRQNPEQRENQTEESFFDPSGIPDLAFGMLAFLPQQQELMEEDRAYKAIFEESETEYLNGKKPNELKGEDKDKWIEKRYGHLFGDEKSLHKETEKAFREQFNKKSKYYDRQKLYAYDDHSKDPRIIKTKEEIASCIAEAGLEKDLGLSREVKKAAWREFVKNNPEKAAAYASKDLEIKEAYDEYWAKTELKKRSTAAEEETKISEKPKEEIASLPTSQQQTQQQPEQGENEKAQDQQQGGTNMRFSSKPTPAEAVSEETNAIAEGGTELAQGEATFAGGEFLEETPMLAEGTEALTPIMGGEAAGTEAIEAAATRAEEKNVAAGFLGKRGERNAARKAARLANRAERNAARKAAFTAIRTALPVIGPIIAVIVIVLILMLGPLGGGGGETTPASADNNPPQSNQPNIASCVTLDIQPPTQNIKINDAVTYNVHVTTNNCPETIAVRYKLPADQGLGYLNPTTPKTGTKPNENQLECDFSQFGNNFSTNQLTCNQTATSDHQVIWDLSKAGSCSSNPNEYDLKLCLRALKATTSTTTPMTDVFFDALPISQIQQSAQAPQTTTQRQGGDLVILGDSITYQAFNTPDKSIINEGINNNTSNDGLIRIKDVLKTYPTNKFFGIAYGAQDAENKVLPNTFKKNLENIIATITTAGAVPILATISPRYSSDPKLPGNQFDVTPYNDIIKQLTITNNLTPGPDLYTYFQQHPHYYHDYVHPNQSGINGIRSLWEETLKNLK